MLVKEKITGSQLEMLLIPLVLGAAILSVPAIVVGFAKQDACIGRCNQFLVSLLLLLLIPFFILSIPDIEPLV